MQIDPSRLLRIRLFAAFLAFAPAIRAFAEEPLFRNPQAPLEQRVENLLQQLTLEEKVALCYSNSPGPASAKALGNGDATFYSGGIPRLGIDHLVMLDRRGMLRSTAQPIYTISLPCALSLSCTWDEMAAEKYGGVLAEEMLALHRQVLLAPIINLQRSPLAGRNYEQFGEDPFLTGQLGADYIRAVQDRGVGANPGQLVANDYETRRHFTSSNMDERTLWEVQMLPFEMAITDGHAWTIMSGNNLFNGIHCAENRTLLQEDIKDRLGFDGVMLTDWRAAYETLPTALAGTDMTTGICSYVFGDGHLLHAVKTGPVPMTLLDDKVRRILRLYIRCGLVDPVTRAKGGLDTPGHRALARSLAAEGMVLLKNEKNLLPLDFTKLHKILVTGPGAQIVQGPFRGGGTGNVRVASEVTPVKGLQTALAGKAKLIQMPWSFTPTAPVKKEDAVERQADANDKAIPMADIPALCRAARSADAVVFIARDEVHHEQLDALSMNLPGNQAEAIDKLAQANPNVIVVLATCGAVTLDPWEGKVPAILGAWYAGQSTGDAMADVLTGKVNPSGKLSFTFGKRLEDYPCHALGEWPPKLILAKDPVNAGMTPQTRRDLHAFDTDYNENVFVGYRWFDEKKIEPWFPFGYGLNYTTFAFDNLGVDDTKPAIHVTCTVKNTGQRAGGEVVEVYVAPPKSSVSRPLKELKGFAKVFLQPGESKKVEITLRPSALAFYDVTSKKWKAEAGSYEIQVGDSSRAIYLRDKIQLAADRLVEVF